MYSEWASEVNPNWAERSVGETEADLRNQLPAYDRMHERVCFDAPTRVAPQEYSSSCPYENVAGRELFCRPGCNAGTAGKTKKGAPS